MASQLRNYCGLILALSLSSNGLRADETPAFDTVNAIDFAVQIKPILAARCYGCHGPSEQKSDLRLDHGELAMKAGDSSSPIIVPGKSAQSELFTRISSSSDDERMPPKGERLTKSQIELIQRWIDSGAVWPDDPASIAKVDERNLTAEQRAYWAYQPIVKPALPSVNQIEWVSTPVDRFILAKLEKEGLSPAPEASRLDLIRRLSFDLTGLPPTLKEIDGFLEDQSVDAYETLVDYYLASPRYGERWGQRWLDVVRFAESEGFEYDRPVASLWKYRDYVINSLNGDKPYDQFIREQIAGDEIEPSNHESLIAAGFHRLGPVRRNAGNQEVASSRNEVLTDRTDIIGAAFLGMTIGCARCHDHKFDAILQRDYYQLQAYLAAVDAEDIPLVSTQEQQEWRAKTSQMTRQIQQLKRQMATATDDERLKLKVAIDDLEDEFPLPLPGISTIKDLAEPTKIHILMKGEWTRKGDAVGMRAPTVLVSNDSQELPIETPQPRKLLAEWMTDPSHPLVPRVMVNRIWQGHFGLGFVKTPNDFGINGDRSPNHRELLDYLSGMFVEGGWRLKPLHKMILMSSVYRQAYNTPLAQQAITKDPENRWLWHFERRRLEAGEIRDGMLTVSGKLNLKMGGESVFLPVDPDLPKMLYKPSQWIATRNREEHFRRSVYLVAKRNLRLPSMEVFDEPTLGASCGRRESSTHAPQALEMLNGQSSNELAALLAQRLIDEAGDDPSQQVDLAFRLAAGRFPTPQEKLLSIEFLRNQSLKEFSLAIFNLNAFLYVN